MTIHVLTLPFDFFPAPLIFFFFFLTTCSFLHAASSSPSTSAKKEGPMTELKSDKDPNFKLSWKFDKTLPSSLADISEQIKKYKKTGAGVFFFFLFFFFFLSCVRVCPLTFGAGPLDTQKSLAFHSMRFSSGRAPRQTSPASFPSLLVGYVKMVCFFSLFFFFFLFCFIVSETNNTRHQP